jgi:hypothetical protein
MGFIQTTNTKFTPKAGYGFKATYTEDTGKSITKKSCIGRTAEEAENALITWMDEQGIIRLNDKAVAV